MSSSNLPGHLHCYLHKFAKSELLTWLKTDSQQRKVSRSRTNSLSSDQESEPEKAVADSRVSSEAKLKFISQDM